MMILRTMMYCECDTESERDLNIDHALLIYTKDTNKWWKIYNGAFVEVLIENLNTVIGKSGVVNFNNERTKNVSFGITFSNVPKVALTLDAESKEIPYKINATTSGFTVQFKSAYIGNVEWTTVRL